MVTVFAHHAFRWRAVLVEASAPIDRRSWVVKGTEGTELVVQLGNWAVRRNFVIVTVSCLVAAPLATFEAGQVRELVQGIQRSLLRRRVRSFPHVELTILLAYQYAEDGFEELSGR